MGALLGPVGGLERVASPTSEPMEAESPLSFSTALSGRVTAQRGPRPRRVWACSEGTIRPEDAALLEGLAAGSLYDQTDGYVWYSSYARVTNILTPWEAVFAENTWSRGAHGGGGVTGDGTRYFRSRTSDPSTTVSLARDVAVPDGGPLVVSVYVSTHPTTAATVSVEEVDPEGAVARTHRAVVPANVHARRAVLPIVASVRTVAVRIHVIGALMFTLPAVTLTHEVQPWASGRGCRHAAVTINGEDPQLAFETPTNYGRRAGRSFTIHELG